jgi:hypothetical protein
VTFRIAAFAQVPFPPEPRIVLAPITEYRRMNSHPRANYKPRVLSDQRMALICGDKYRRGIYAVGPHRPLVPTSQRRMRETRDEYSASSGSVQRVRGQETRGKQSTRRPKNHCSRDMGLSQCRDAPETTGWFSKANTVSAHPVDRSSAQEKVR